MMAAECVSLYVLYSLNLNAPIRTFEIVGEKGEKHLLMLGVHKNPALYHFLLISEILQNPVLPVNKIFAK